MSFMYKYIQKLWEKPKENLGDLHKERLIQWRKEPRTVKVERPTRLDRARSLGYKAKQGIIIVRQRVNRGGRQRPRITSGRRSKRRGSRKVVSKSYKQICEERAQQVHTNLEVLNSYFVGKDKLNYWYEIILVDPDHPVTRKEFAWMKKNPKRVLRGKTSAGQKSRGLGK
jgi:large subunit ribosomal protein L15e